MYRYSRYAVTHVTTFDTYCDNCIQDRCKISFHSCDTQLVEGEISLPVLPLHDFESMVKMYTFPLLTLHKTTSNRSFHVYQHVTSFSHMRGALVGRRTTAAGFHM